VQTKALKKLLFLAVLMPWLTLYGQVQQHRLHRIGPEQGLPEGYIHGILQDRSGIMWFASYEGLYRYNGFTIEPVRSEGINDTNTLSNERVMALLEDHRGDIWAGTLSGLNRIDRQTGRVTRYQNSPESKVLPGNGVNRLFMDSRHRIWMNASDGLAVFDPETRKLRIIAEGPRILCWFEDAQGNIWGGNNKAIYQFEPQTGTFILRSTNKGYSITSAARDANKQIWLGTSKGLFQFDPQSVTVKPAGIPGNITDSIVVSALHFRNNTLHIGTFQGLYIWNLKANRVQHITATEGNPEGMRTPFVYHVYCDRNNNIWMGNNLGISRLPASHERFRYYLNFPDKPAYEKENHNVRISEDSDGNIWTWNNGGIFRSKGLGSIPKFIPGQPYTHFIEGFIEAQVKGKNELLLAFSTPGKGMYRFNRETEKFEVFHLNEWLNNNSLFQVEPDQNDPGSLWIGTLSGLCHFNLRNADTFWLRPLGHNHPVQRFFQGHAGKLFMVIPDGYAVYDRNSGTSTLHLYKQGEANMYISPRIRDITESKNGDLWINTESGLTYRSAATGKYLNFNHRNGIKGGNIIYGLMLDKQSRAWFTTSTHLTCLDPRDMRFRYFTRQDGIYTSFNRISMCRLRNGNMVFGGISGLMVVNADSVILNQNPASVILTDFRVNNRSRLNGYYPEFLREIGVSYSENALLFEFASPEMIAPDKNEYAYRLEGFDSGWIYSGTERRAAYTNLPPGTYYFLAKAANSDGYWEETETLKVKVRILPLYYQTWWFRTLAILVAASLLLILYRNRKQKNQLLQQKFLAEQNARYKSKFLTNMSHEIRTPMNAILGLNRLLLDTSLNQKQREYAEAVQQSSENLLWIVNDILDQARIESGSYTILHKSFRLDIILRQVQSLLRIKAEEKKLAFNLYLSNAVPVKLIGDPVRLYQILVNLAGNAIKFTSQGEVKISAELVQSTENDATIRFLVSDTGPGIAPEKLAIIFDSFRQADEDNRYTGTGLGLSIARELAIGMNGSLDVESTPGIGSVFSLELPLVIDHTGEVANKNTKTPARSTKAMRILVVDDTRFNLMLATELLSEHFPYAEIDTAENGQVALEKLNIHRYQLVLMDVKMPVMDGLEATKRIRKHADETIRNIPVIGLTANAIDEQIAACQESGMNACVTKPINAAELFSKIEICIQEYAG
jgi:signal transduction histidine kinase/ligand-binding sensor domain-containing protein/CheY-like chemotaxis protein